MASILEKTVNVMIVEDYKLTRMGLKSSLEEFEGISVTGEAEDAEKGLLVAERIKPDVILPVTKLNTIIPKRSRNKAANLPGTVFM
mgnify:CR=1 FL=1